MAEEIEFIMSVKKCFFEGSSLNWNTVAACSYFEFTLKSQRKMEPLDLANKN